MAPTASPTPTPPTGWDYKQKGTLNASGACGNLSDYQVRLVVHEGVGTSSGSDVYLNHHCDSNFSDLRFTRADGVSLLDHWLEKGSLETGAQATFWVEFDNISTAGTEFYVYYGNPNASSDSDGEATWDFFDDFEGSAIDTERWDEINSPGGVVSNSELYISKTVSSSGINHGYKTKASFDNCRMLSRGKTGYSQTDSAAATLAQYSELQCNNRVFWRKDNVIRLVGDMRGCGGDITNNATNSSFALNTYYTCYYVRKDADYIRSWEDGVYNGEVTSNVRDGNDAAAIYVQFWNSQLSTQDVTVDWFAVGQYCGPDPAWGGWTPDASEPTPTPSTTPTPTPTPTDTPTGTYGDLTGDGVVDSFDYADIKPIILGLKECDPRADTNMDGCVNSLDYAKIKAIVLGHAAAHGMYIYGYDFSSGAGTAHLAAYKQVNNMPTLRWVSDSGWTNFSAGDYTDVEAIDSSNFSMGANASAYNAVQCRFTVGGGINLSAVTSLNVTLVGYSTGIGAELQLWAWNFDTSSWQQIDDGVSMSGVQGTLTGSTACDCWGRVFESYVDGNSYMYVLFLLDTLNSDLNANYIKTELMYP